MVEIVGFEQPDILIVLPAQHDVAPADPAREQRHALVAGHPTGERAHMDGAKIDAVEQLLPCVTPVEGGIGADDLPSPVIFREPDQSQILDAVALAGQDREDHRFGDVDGIVAEQLGAAAFHIANDARRIGKWAGRIDRDLAVCAPGAGPESHRRDMPLADSAQRQDKPAIAVLIHSRGSGTMLGLNSAADSKANSWLK